MADRSASAAQPPGLVHSSTSENGVSATLSGAVLKAAAIRAKAVLVDRVRTRLKKMRHGVLTAARLQGEGHVRRGRRYRPAMVTLTYDSHGALKGAGGGSDWRPRHLSEYIERARKFLHKQHGEKLRYVWVAEMQLRGVVHYHVMVWLPYVAHCDSKGRRSMRPAKLPKPDECGWWPHGMSEIAWAEKAAGYLAKYCSKGEEGPEFPKGIRISGVGGLDAEGKREARWWRAPSEAREALGAGADIRRIPGGRFCALSGLFWESPWMFTLLDGKPALLLKKEMTPCE